MENWGDGSDVEAVILRKVAEKVAGVVAADNPKKKAEAIDAEADKKVEVIQRHRKEWVQVGALRQEALSVRATNPDLAFNKAKLAKITAEMTKIQQEGERKAWGLDASLSDNEIASMSIEEIEDRLRKG